MSFLYPVDQLASTHTRARALSHPRCFFIRKYAFHHFQKTFLFSFYILFLLIFASHLLTKETHPVYILCQLLYFLLIPLFVKLLSYY